MSTPYEHQGIGTHEDEWRPGLTCDDCRARHQSNVARRQQAPMANLARLRSDNEAGVTQHGMARETYEAARASGDDLQVAR
jgi:hypothetical protein